MFVVGRLISPVHTKGNSPTSPSLLVEPICVLKLNFERVKYFWIKGFLYQHVNYCLECVESLITYRLRITCTACKETVRVAQETLCLSCESQPVTVQGYICCLVWDPYKKPNCDRSADRRSFVLESDSIYIYIDIYIYIYIYSNHWDLLVAGQRERGAEEPSVPDPNNRCLCSINLTTIGKSSHSATGVITSPYIK
jgi:hypothetical protein